MRDKKTKFLFAILLISVAVLANPRDDALGGIYSSPRSGTDAIGGNPAALSENPFHQISANATSYWLGVSEFLV